MGEKRENQPPQESKKRDYYEVLGVPRSVNDAEIKKAYRRMARSIHPDQNPGDSDATANFQELSAAYEVLSDPQRRAVYDEYGHGGDFRVNADAVITVEKVHELARRLEEISVRYVLRSSIYYNEDLRREIKWWYGDAVKAGIAREKIQELLNAEKIQEFQVKMLLEIISFRRPGYDSASMLDQYIIPWQEVGLDLRVVLKSGHPKIRESITALVLRLLYGSLYGFFDLIMPDLADYLRAVQAWKKRGVDVSDAILSPELRDLIERFLLELKIRPWRRKQYVRCFKAWLEAGWQPTEDMSVKELQLLNQEERKEEREQDEQLHKNIQYFRFIESKAKAGKDLSREDVVFLHDIPVFCCRVDQVWRHAGSIEEPILEQIKEFYAKRGVEEMRRDIALLYQCSLEEVAFDRKTVNKKTKVYVGKLFDGFFDKLSHVQHIYTSFPYSKVVRDTVVLNTPISQIETELGRSGVGISPRASDSLELLKKENADLELGAREFTLISVRASDLLGTEGMVMGDQLLARTKRFGLEPCPPLVGLQYFVALFKTPGHWLIKNEFSLFVESWTGRNSFCVQNKAMGFGRGEGVTVSFDGFYLDNELNPKNGRYTYAQLVFLKPKNPEKNWMLKLLGF